MVLLIMVLKRSRQEGAHVVLLLPHRLDRFACSGQAWATGGQVANLAIERRGMHVRAIRPGRHLAT